MIIREAVIDDALTMKELHDRAVLELCRNDYTIDQLKGWVNKSPLEKYLWRLERQRSFVAESDGNMLGYVRWLPEENLLCSICVKPEFARQGIATTLMEAVYKDARDLNMKTLWLEASLTAVPFYQRLGWDYVALITDGPLDCVRMEIQLDPKNDQENPDVGEL
jgi:putative acetyltransferase